jgi:atypical dual specificity phosphatase
MPPTSFHKLWWGLTAKPFTWIVPEQVAACTYPKRVEDLQQLAARGVTLLINLHRRPHDPDLLQAQGLAERHLPVADFQPPAPVQLAAGLAAIEKALAAGGKVAVHCRGGLGRTGTLLACYLIRTGMAADDALAHLRRLRPGSVESRSQEQAVRAFAADLGR